MDESEDNLSSEDLKSTDSPVTAKTKAKKRSLIERELETSLTARITSPVTIGDGTSTSRYGRARRLKSEIESTDIKKVTSELKSPLSDKSPMSAQASSPVYKMHASNSPLKRSDSPKKVVGEKNFDNQIESIYQENISLSRFSSEEVATVTPSPAKKFPKVYIRKDLIQKREPEETVMLIQNIFSPVKSAKKSNSHLNNILERSSERYNLNSKQQNGHVDNSSVVKTLDFDSKRKKKHTKDAKAAPKSELLDFDGKRKKIDTKDTKAAVPKSVLLDFDGKRKKKDTKDAKATVSKSELFEMEAKCLYQVGDLAWARMGTYPFWPCIVTRDPASAVFVKKKLFGRIERDIIHVTFFGDNGRRGWIVDSMLRKYLGQLEFETTRENFTPEDKKKDPRLYAAFFISEKKQLLWNTSIEEAETLLKEPKRLRIDIFNDMLEKSRGTKLKQPRSKISRTDSDVSLSESLYDSLFSEDDGKSDNNDKSGNRSRNKSLDMFEVVTACLDNMAAKTGITKIQRQSHMDRWLQKAKSKTPEKTKAHTQVPIKKLEEKKEIKIDSRKRKKITSTKKTGQKAYRLRRTNESEHLTSNEDENNGSVSTQNVVTDSHQTSINTESSKHSKEMNEQGIIVKVESLAQEIQDSENEKEGTILNESTATESAKESSVDMNETCESVTYTDDDSKESKDTKNSANVEYKLDSNGLNIDHSTESVDNCNTESQNTELKQPFNNNQDSDMQDLVKTQDITDSENIADSAALDTDTGIKKNESLDINDKKNVLNCSEVLDVPEDIKDIITEPLSNLGSRNINGECKGKDRSLNKCMSSKISKTCSNKEDTLRTGIDANILETDVSSQNISNIVEEDRNIESSTKVNKESRSINTAPCNEDKEVSENEAEISLDEDSDSERLPYSPLSVLGNNSDDNLSLDDVPFVDENVPEFENDPNNSANKKISNSVVKKNDKNINFTNGDLQNNVSHESVEPTKYNSKDKSMDINISLCKQALQNGHISDDNDIYNKAKTIYKQDVSDISKNKKHGREVPVKNKDNIQNNMESAANNGYRGKNVREIEMASKEVSIYISEQIPDTVNVNGFYDMNDTDRASVHSDDSAASTKSESRRRLRSKHDKKQEDNPLENKEFLKYMELKQDSIMDENPELSEKDIVNYLYKTWIYEENAKSDVKKNEDLRESNLVKGLNQVDMEPITTSTRRRHLSLNKSKTTKQTNTLRNFLHRKNDVNSINDSDNDEIITRKKRGVRKNMIKDDDDDCISIKEKEKRESPRNIQKVIDVKLSEANVIENSNDNEKLQDKDLSESSKESTSVDLEKKVNHELIERQDSACLKDPTVASTVSTKSEESIKTDIKLEKLNEFLNDAPDVRVTPPVDLKIKLMDDFDADSVDSEDSETPLIRCKLRSKAKKEIMISNGTKESSVECRLKVEEPDTISINSEDSEISITKRKKKASDRKIENAMEDPEFVKYLELRQDALIEENPALTQDEIVTYLYQTWLYEEEAKSEIKKNDEIEQSNLIKGLNEDGMQPKKIRRKVPKIEKLDKDIVDEEASVKEKPKRKSVKPFYNEEYSDIEEELEVFEIFKPKNKEQLKQEPGEVVPETVNMQVPEVYDEVELYFAELTKSKPNVFKGLIREKVCEICEKTSNLVKCKGCNGMFHVDCVKKEVEIVDVPTPSRGRKKKKRQGRKPKNSEEYDDDKCQDISEENNASIEEIVETDAHTVDADVLEAQLSAKMKEFLDNAEAVEFDSYSSDDCLDWNESVPGKCELIEIKLKPRPSESDYSDFKCNDCQKYSPPICFVCKSAVSKTESTKRQKCHVAHCQKYYHLECLDHWPQTQFNGGEPSKTNKKVNEYFEALTCPRHVCHTCVSDDPRGCKTRFSGDKLARCVRCPATYHSFTKCLPAGTQILTASHIVCPRHYEHRSGKVPCHVNTGWCFICALGGSLICCEYCPTSFHAECLNIDPPEGGYMCEDCETGRLPLYGEMVWVKLGHYRWWPGIILHPYEIPENLLAVKHSHGEFVVRFFGQYDHYWVNRGRVFPFQEGDSGRVSSQKSKIDAAFTTAMEHAQRACEILKSAQPNAEESSDIASSLLPPHYVKLKVNKPCGSLCGRKLEDPESSLTQCECDPQGEDTCGLYSQCLNRMLLTECGPTCRAGDRCNNRAFEKRQYPKLTPYRTPSRGWGLKTLEDIKAGQFVIEYVGELIDEEEFRRRMRRMHEMRDENFYFLTLDKERMIDAGPKGNLARFMNHCCEPNCETQKWTVLGDVRVGLFALYDIPAHSEVTFNYNLECAGIDKKRCMCGAKRCSGYIGAKPKQEESQPKKNKLHPGKRSYKKRKPEESPSTKSTNNAKRPIGRPRKPRELTEIEKDLLIIRTATNGISSDESSRSISTDCEGNPKALKRKRVSFSTEEVIVFDGTESPNVKKTKLDESIETQ